MVDILVENWKGGGVLLPSFKRSCFKVTACSYIITSLKYLSYNPNLQLLEVHVFTRCNLPT